MQQPTAFELTVNVKRAKELGVTMPPTVIAREQVDRVIVGMSPIGTNATYGDFVCHAIGGTAKNICHNSPVSKRRPMALK
jgi:hypothetical protein